MFLMFSQGRASVHLPVDDDGKPKPAGPGTTEARELRSRFDSLRRVATGVAHDEGAVQEQADNVPDGVWVVNTRDWSVSFVAANRDPARDKSIADEEAMWARARRFRDGWKRRHLG